MDKDREKEPTRKPNPMIEKQIEEILRNSERSYRRKIFWTRFSSGLNGFFSRAGKTGGSPSPYARLMMWGLLLTLGGILIRGFSSSLASLLVLGGIVLFLSPIFLSFRRTSGGSGASGYSGDEKYWRGRPVVTGDPWGSTKQQFNGVMRWLRGGDKKPPSPPRSNPRR